VRLVFLRKSVASACALAFAAHPMAPPAVATPITRAEYEACHVHDNQNLRARIEAITLKAVEEALVGVDYRGIVTRAWQSAGLDETLDKRVDLVIEEVRNDSSWIDLLRSIFVADNRKELATTVAERVFRSDALKVGFERLATGVSKELGKSIEYATLGAADPSARCLRAFLTSRYGYKVASVITDNTKNGSRVDPGLAAPHVSPGDLLAQGSEGIAGSVLLLVRRQLSNIVARLAHRLVGPVLGGLVSTFAGIVGIALLGKELLDMRDGVLPIIAEAMKARSTKERVLEELAKTADQQIRDHVPEITWHAAEGVMEIWHEFRRAHEKVLALAERNPGFKSFLDGAKAEQLPVLDRLVELEGERLLKRLDDGTLQDALNKLNAAGVEIARETRSIDAALLWARLADGRLPRVLELELHKRSIPDDLSERELGRLLALRDDLAIKRLISVPRDVRDVLFPLADGALETLGRGLSESELQALSQYLTRLERNASERLLGAVANTPARMQPLAPPGVLEGILKSHDQLAAVEMMLRSDSLKPWIIVFDFKLVFDDRVHRVLLWHKHPAVLAMLAAAALMLAAAALILSRLLFGALLPPRWRREVAYAAIIGDL
jgi:hypothetical protein